MLTTYVPNEILEKQNSSVIDSNFDKLIDAWEMAKTAYQRVLEDGVTRPDIALAQDQSYNCLLMAGQKIYLLGGPSAVSSAARRLGDQSVDASVHHFDRLWCGLLPSSTARPN